MTDYGITGADRRKKHALQLLAACAIISAGIQGYSLQAVSGEDEGNHMPQRQESAAGHSSGSCRLDAQSVTDVEAGCKQAWLDANIRINEIQVLGTHNSYKQFISVPEFEILKKMDPGVWTREYGHAPIIDQLKAGMRNFEFDVAGDPNGGLYANPLLYRKAVEAGTNVPDLEYRDIMLEPGFKIMHDPDIDYRTSCPTFKSCLQILRNWSDENRNHVPILILINPKVRPYSGLVGNPAAVVPPPFDKSTFEDLEKELLDVIPIERLITPDEVRGQHATLKEGAMAGNWPLLGAARGRFIVAILDRPPFSEPYYKDNPSLKGRAMFVYAPKGHPAAIYYTIDDPIEDRDEILDLVRQGFLVRTRTEQDTVEVRNGSTKKREAAFLSGAQFITTDYYVPNKTFSDYSVALPGGGAARCNPVLVPAKCDGFRINE